MSLIDRIRIDTVETLSDDWAVLRKTRFDYLGSDGVWRTLTRETYDRGDGATVLLYDPDRRTIVLTRQLRFPAYVKGHHDLLVETPAGLLDEATPEERIRAETEEETGFRLRDVTRVFDLFMSPGSVTERLSFFVARYAPKDRVAAGGGVADEGEDIETFELSLAEALAMIKDGRIIDAKTVILIQYAALNLIPTA